MITAVLQKEKTHQNVRPIQQNHSYGICPVCLRRRKWETYEVCPYCQKDYREWAIQTQNEKGIVLDSKMWTYAHCIMNIDNLREELSRAEEEAKELFNRAKENVKSFLHRERISGLDEKTYREMLFAKFDELFGRDKRKQLSSITRRYPSIITSLEALKSRMELRMQQEVDETTIAQVA